MSNRRTYLLTDRSSTSNHKKRIQVQVPPKKDKNQLEKNAEKIVRSRNEKKL